MYGHLPKCVRCGGPAGAWNPCSKCEPREQITRHNGRILSFHSRGNAEFVEEQAARGKLEYYTDEEAAEDEKYRASSRLSRDMSEACDSHNNLFTRKAVAGNALMPVVYFIQAGDCGPIKIGFSDGGPVGAMVRLEEISPGCPHPVKMLGYIPGGKEVERSLHRRFSHFWLKHEWFEPHPDLIKFMDKHMVRANG